MYKLIATLIVAALAGVPTYLLVFAGHFGVSRGAPIGSLEPIEGWLTDQGFSKSTLTSIEANNQRLKGSTFLQFTEEGSSMQGSGRYAVYVGVAESGSVQAIRMSFYSEKPRIGIPNSKTEEFATQLWKEVTGSNPTFQERHRGEGIRFIEGMGATFASSTVTGDWYKRYQERNKPRSIVDFVSFTIR